MMFKNNAGSQNYFSRRSSVLMNDYNLAGSNFTLHDKVNWMTIIMQQLDDALGAAVTLSNVLSTNEGVCAMQTPTKAVKCKILQCAHPYIHLCVRVHTPARAHTCTRTHACTHVRTRTCTHMHPQAPTYSSVTHTHSQTSSASSSPRNLSAISLA